MGGSGSSYEHSTSTSIRRKPKCSRLEVPFKSLFGQMKTNNVFAASSLLFLGGIAPKYKNYLVPTRSIQWRWLSGSIRRSFCLWVVIIRFMWTWTWTKQTFTKSAQITIPRHLCKLRARKVEIVHTMDAQPKNI